MSVVAPTRSTPLEVPVMDRGAAEITSSAVDGQRGHIVSIGSTETGPDDHAHTSGPGGVAAPSPSGRNHSGAAGANRRSASQNAAARELADSLPTAPRVKDLASTTAPTDGLSAAGPEAPSGGADGGAGDPAGAASIVGWAPGAATSVIGSLANPPGVGIGLDGRTGSGPQASAAANVPQGSVAAVIPGPEVPGSGPRDTPGALDRAASEPSQRPVMGVAANGAATAQSWGDLLVRALQPDWEAVDGQLRQFLSRLGGLADAPVGVGAGPSWPLWIAAATALILVHRASRSPRRLFRRPVPGAVLLTSRHPVPVGGPWPMGAP